MTKTREQEAKEKIHLEDRLLVRTSKRFRRTRFSKVNHYESGNLPYRLDNYIIERKGFKERLFLTENLDKGSQEYSLWIIKPDGRLFETFESKNKTYAPILKQMYENIRERAIQDEREQKKKAKIESERKDREYYRI
jgi:hypothetical protein